MRIVNITFVVLALGTLPSKAQEAEFNAGFKILKLYDSTRGYKPIALPYDSLYYRPIHVDLWYPAKIDATDTTALLYDLVQLLEIRSKFYDDVNDFRGLTEEMLQFWCAAADCPDYNSLKTLRTESYPDARPIPGAFPLVIYFAGFNGMSYENYSLFEALAKKGFIVAAISSIGRYPGNMTMEWEDLIEQINDGKFVKDYLTKNNLLRGKAGLVGYSWGGLAAALLAMADPSAFSAVVSLDGSEHFHYYGNEDDEKLNRIRSSKMFDPNEIMSPYLYLGSDPAASDILPDSVYDFTNALAGEKFYFTIKSATHDHFSSFSLHSNGDARENYQHIQKLTISYLSDKLMDENIFNSSIPQEGIVSQFSPVRKNPIDKNQKVLIGTILDTKTKTPLPYVNIGIPGRDIGTTTNAAGKFELRCSDVSDLDSLRISMVGYETIAVNFNTLTKKSPQQLTLYLREKTSALEEVVVTEKKLKTKTLGNKSQSKFFGGKFGSNDLGSEIAIKIHNRRGPVYLEKFQFNISYNFEDTATFRLNVYNVKDGMPDKNILSRNILVRIGKNRTGKIEVDLSNDNVVVNDDFFIGLEWVEGSKNSGIVFSAGFVNKGTYYRKASQGRWKKYAIGVGFNVKATY